MSVVVLGMHRSGTSAVAGCLAQLGLHPGYGRLLPAHESNPKGFWEQEALMRFNEDLLRALGGRWWIPPAMPPVSERPLRKAAEHLPRAESLFARTFRTAPWVWKDPRLCLLFWFWRPIIGEQCVVVFVYRHPLEVWRSLERRDGFPARESLLLWELYNLAALWHAATLPCVVVSYDELMSTPEATVDRIVLALLDFGIELRAPLDPPAFLERSLRHWRAGEAELAEHPAVTSQQRALYGRLCELEHAYDSLPLIPELAAQMENCLAQLERSNEPRWIWELLKRGRRWTVPWQFVMAETRRRLFGSGAPQQQPQAQSRRAEAE